jgi:hypothetical protein
MWEATGRFGRIVGNSDTNPKESNQKWTALHKQVLINKLTVHVGTGIMMSGTRTSQELPPSHDREHQSCLELNRNAGSGV